jgi:MFS family permease
MIFAVPLLVWTTILARSKSSQHSRKPHEDAESFPHAKDQVVSLRTHKSSFITLGFSILLVTMGLNSLASGSVMTFMTTYMTSQTHLTIEVASIIFGVGPLVGIIGSLMGGYLGSKLGQRNGLTMTYVGQIAFLLGILVIPSVHLAMLSFLAYQMFSAALWVPASSIVTSLIDKCSGGKAYSLYFFSGDAFGAVAPIIAATLITSFNIVSPFILAVGLLMSNTFLIRLISAD